MVAVSLPRWANCGQYRPMGASSSIFPSSSNFQTAAAVKALETEKVRKGVSSLIMELAPGCTACQIDHLAAVMVDHQLAMFQAARLQQFIEYRVYRFKFGSDHHSHFYLVGLLLILYRIITFSK